MPRIRIVTDSTCDIPDGLLRQFDITVVPFTVQVGADAYLDKVSISTDQLLKRLYTEGESSVQVHSPPIEEFSRTYRSMRETCDGVLSIHVSSKLSDAVSNAAVAREAFGPIGQGGPFPVAVVDSLSFSMGLGWIVLAVARAALLGVELPKLSSMATRLTGLSHVAFFTEQLEGLMKSGAAARLGSQLDALAQLRPLFHLDEGQVAVYERTRIRVKARDSLYNFVEDFPKIGELAVIHTGAVSDVEHLLTRVGAIYPRERVVLVQPGPAVATWLGPEALGVAVLEGEE
jgi:DegV family protein with EDD domain